MTADMNRRLTFHSCASCGALTVLHSDGLDAYGLDECGHAECACGGEFDPVADTAAPGCRLELRQGELWLIRTNGGKEKRLLRAKSPEQAPGSGPGHCNGEDCVTCALYPESCLCRCARCVLACGDKKAET